MVSIFIFIALVLFIAYSVLGWTLFFMQHKFIFKPSNDVTYSPEEISLDYEDITFYSEDGVRLSAWYIPAKNAKATILYCHGNGGNLMHCLDTINIFNELGLNCFVFDYRGYGNSGSKPSEAGTYLDAEAAYDWLTREKKIPADDIIIFGRSLGGSVATYLASKKTSAALVIESCFTSYIDIGKSFYPYMPVRLFARFSYNSMEYIKNVTCPTMVIHSKYDEVVPFELGLKLYRAANTPKRFIEIKGKHNDGFLYANGTYKKAWRSWLDFLDLPASSSIRKRA